MSVYVDDMRAPFGRMVMCHMMADTHEELVGMADRIGVNRRWIQDAGTPKEHFDVSLGKRKLAVAAGAKEITWRESAQLLIDKLGLSPPHTAPQFGIRDGSVIAVSELAKEFRRLAADLRTQADNSTAPFWRKRWRGRAEGLEQAAQMLEEKLNG